MKKHLQVALAQRHRSREPTHAAMSSGCISKILDDIVAVGIFDRQLGHTALR